MSPLGSGGRAYGILVAEETKPVDCFGLWHRIEPLNADEILRLFGVVCALAENPAFLPQQGGGPRGSFSLPIFSQEELN